MYVKAIAGAAAIAAAAFSFGTGAASAESAANVTTSGSVITATITGVDGYVTCGMNVTGTGAVNATSVTVTAGNAVVSVSEPNGTYSVVPFCDGPPGPVSQSVYFFAQTVTVQSTTPPSSGGSGSLSSGSLSSGSLSGILGSLGN